MVSDTYFRNLNGPDFGPFDESVGAVLSVTVSADDAVPFLVVSPLSLLGATLLGGGGGVGRLKVITLPRGLAPLGIAPSLKGPSCGGSAFVAVALLEAAGAFLSAWVA